MDAPSDNNRNKGKSFLILIVPVVIGSAIYLLSENEKELKQITPKQKSQRKPKTQKKILKPKSEVANITPYYNNIVIKTYNQLYEKDEARIKLCGAEIWKTVEKTGDYGEFKIIDFDKTLSTMASKCSFRIKSEEYKWGKLEQIELPPEIVSRNQLKKPYLFYLSAYREFFKDRVSFFKNLNRLIDFYKSHLYEFPPMKVSDFYALVGILEEFLKVCGHEITEGELLVQDIDKENNDLNELFVDSQGNKERMNKYLKARKEIILIYRERLRDLFQKYQEDLKDCQ